MSDFLIDKNSVNLSDFFMRHPLIGLDHLLGTLVEGEFTYDDQFEAYVVYRSGDWYITQDKPNDVSVVGSVLKNVTTTAADVLDPIKSYIWIALIVGILLILILYRNELKGIFPK